MLKTLIILLPLFLCCMSPVTTMAQATQIVRNPYLQSATSSSMVIKWRTNKATDSQVWYGDSPSRLLQLVQIDTLTIDHEVTISNLEPDKTYYYAVGNSDKLLVGNDTQHYFKTAPMTGTSKATVAWVLGDAGTANSAQRAVRDAYYNYIGDKHTDMILLLGDNAYNVGTDSEYQRALFNTYDAKLKNTHLWSAPGNHEYYAKGGLNADYYDIFTFPTKGEAGGLASNTEKYYAFDYGNIHFISLDSHDEKSDIGSPMLTWLENDLANTTQDWIVVIFHHPPYSKGSHDSDREGKLIKMRENVVPLLEDYGVDLVLSGHSHSYERTKLIQGHYGPSITYDSTLHAVDGGNGRINEDGAYQKNPGDDGTVYIVTGSAGKKSGMRGRHPAMYYSVSQLGSTILELEDSIMHIKFLNDKGIVEDNLTIDKKKKADNVEEGEIITESCDGNTTITYGNGQIKMEGIEEQEYFFQILDATWQGVYNCGWQCGSSQIVKDLPAGNYRVYIKNNSHQVICEKEITVSAYTGGGDPDNDGDGVPASLDCNDEDANLTIIGATCNDGDATTENDKVALDCSCEGTSINTNGGNTSISCGDNTSITYGNGAITMAGLAEQEYFFQILDATWRGVYNCGWQCGSSQTVTDLPAGDYRVYIKNSSYQIICEQVITVTADNDNGGDAPDNDEDGVLASLDCNDEDANLTIIGAPCTDGDASTENDVVLANCTCAGTPIDTTGSNGTVITCGDATITYGNGNIQIIGQANTAYFFKINDLDAGWAQVADCGWNCGSEFTATDLTNRNYLVTILNDDWSVMCSTEITMSSSSLRPNPYNINRQATLACSNNPACKNKQSTNFGIYPNPANEVAFINLTAYQGQTIDLVIYNQIGQSVFEQTIDKVAGEEIRLDTKNFVNGLYLVKVLTAGEKSISKKLMVAR